MRKLSQLSLGERAFVHSIEDEELEQKLFEMGFTPGQMVEIERKSPLSDPIAVLASNLLLSIRLVDANKIIVSSSANQ